MSVAPGITLAGIKKAISENDKSKKEIVDAYEQSRKVFGALNEELFQNLSDALGKIAVLSSYLTAAKEAVGKEPDYPGKDAQMEVLKQIRAYIEPINVYASDVLNVRSDELDAVKKAYARAREALDGIGPA